MGGGAFGGMGMRGGRGGRGRGRGGAVPSMSYGAAAYGNHSNILCAVYIAVILLLLFCSLLS